MLILIFGSKSSFDNDLGQSDAKKIILHHFLASIAMVIPEVPGDQKLSEQVRYAIIRNSQTFSFLDLTFSEL